MTVRRLLTQACGVAPLLALHAALAQNAGQPARPQQPADPQAQQIQVQIQLQGNAQGWVFDPLTQQMVPLGAAVPTPLPTAEALAMVTIDPAIADLVAGLDAPSYERREQAMMSLMAASCEIEQFYAALARMSLSLEQRYRLLDVVRSRLVNAPRGALGVRMRWMQMQFDQPGAVQIEDLIDGLPAKGVLHLGDRITQIDGRPLWSQQDLLMTVQNKRPGDMIRLTVERERVDEAGDPIMDADHKPVVDIVPIDVALGSADQLPREDPGAMVGPSMVLQQRQKTARDVEQQFGPPVKRVAVPQRDDTDAFDEASVPDAEVDSHPLIRQLMIERKALAGGGLADSRELRGIWKMRLNQLAQDTAAPGLTYAQREYLARVYRRFAELIPP